MVKYCSKSLYSQNEELMEKFEAHENLLKETNKLRSNLNAPIKSLSETIEKQKEMLKKRWRNIKIKK